jgi:glucose-6-phosphate 1-dehydrogenase
MKNEDAGQPLVLVIFGITGDLAQRKLLPALYHLLQAGQLPERFNIVGISRRDVAASEVYSTLPSFLSGETTQDDIIAKLAEQTEMVQMDLLDRTAYEQLLVRLTDIEAGLGEHAVRLYYLSIPPQVFSPIIRLLGETGHNHPVAGEGDLSRLLVEKPFGYDLASAQELIDTVDEHFGEAQIYRIDHYVAKETVQNILTFRFKNPLFEAVWDNHVVESIQVTAHEKIGIEGRANFYEQTGALRDLIQSHLLQLLAITTMAKPAKFESSQIHAEKLRLLQAIPPIAPDKVALQTVRGQYEGYREEVGNPDSLIETFARVQLNIDTDQWRGVPITLETGKALAEKKTEISLCFRRPEDDESERNHLVFRIQPEEGITILLQTKRPGFENRTDVAAMNFNYAEAFNERPLEAYERVLIDAFRGDQTLFASAEEVLASWRIIENVLTAWSHSADGLLPYAPGSSGPASIEAQQEQQNVT